MPPRKNNRDRGGNNNKKSGSRGGDQSGPNKKVGFSTPLAGTNTSLGFNTTATGSGGTSGGFNWGGGGAASGGATGGGFSTTGGTTGGGFSTHTLSAPAASGGFSFNSTPAPAPAPAGGGFNFNTGGGSTATPQASAGSGGFNFSANSASNGGGSAVNSGFSFNSSTQGSGQQASGGLSLFNTGGTGTNNNQIPPPQHQDVVNSDTKYHELSQDQQNKLKEVWTFMKEQEASLQTIRDYVSKERGKRPKNLEELDQDAKAFEQDVQRVAVLQQAQQRKIDDATRITWGENESNKVPCLQSVEEHVKKSIGTSRSRKNYPHLPHQFWWQLYESLDRKKDDVQIKLGKIDLVLSCGEEGTSQLNNIRQKLKVQTSSTIHLADFSFQNSQKIEKLKAHFAYKLSDLNLEDLN